VRDVRIRQAPDARKAAELPEARVAEQLLALGVRAIGRVVAAIGAGFEFAPRDLAPAWTEVAA